MKFRPLALFVTLLLFVLVSACDKDDDNPPQQTAAEALGNYWEYQSGLNATLDSREATMNEIEASIANLSTRGDRDAFSDIDALVNTYVGQCDAAAAGFDTMLQAENAIVPYGQSKGILSSIAKGIYNTAKDGVVSSASMVRGGWRVLSGQQSLGQVLRDPETRIPIFSNFAAVVQRRNSARDALIRQAILANDNHEDEVPISELPGATPQEKANAYMNLSDDDPIKLRARARVMIWHEDEAQATAQTAVELGETGVKTIANATGNEYVNEILIQHMEEGQPQTQQGTLGVEINGEGTTNPPVTAPKTIIIAKANRPDEDPRITVLTSAPGELDQPLPTGDYHVIVMAEGFIRGVYENLQIAQGQVNSVITQLLKLAENAIIIEGMTVDSGCVTAGQPLTAHISCLSSIGKSLSFAWTVSGGAYSGFDPNGTDLTFTPTEQKEYTITVTVSDDVGNSKVRSIAVTSLGGQLAIDDWEISAENFVDGKINPGETATVTLFVSNTGTTEISGTQSVTGGEGISVNFSPGQVTFPVGGTVPVSATLTVAPNFSLEEGRLLYSLSTVNANQIPAVISDEQAFPIDFYVTVNPITELVTNRVVSITGKVANPQLTTAVLIVDGDIEHAYDLNLNQGNFYQQVVLGGSTEEVEHNVRVIAVSGALAAEGTMSFDSLVPLMALHATLTWNTNGTDVDFWITDPNGERCYYAHSSTASGLMLDVDDTNGYGPENITSPSVIPGDYLVQVHYYSDHDYENAIGTDCQVVISKDENSNEPPVNYYGFLADTGDLWNVTTLHYDQTRGWSVKPANTHGRVNPATLPAK